MADAAQHIQIRKVVGADAARIAELLTQLNRFEGAATVIDAAHVAAALFHNSAEVKLAALIAEQVSEKEIVGVVLYYPGYDTLTHSYGFHLADMCVDEKHRGEGVGRALMCALAAEAKAQNKSWVSLTTLKKNHGAQKFYETLGMTRVEVDFFAMGERALSQL